MGFAVLVVCTGNICRSPAAELLLRDRIGGLPVVVSSAGTNGLSGHGMDRPSAVAVRELGVDPSQHVARRLHPGLVTAADLILTADTGHRSSVLVAEPLALRRTFTLREFARLGEGLGPLPAITPDALVDRVAEVASRRGRVPAAVGAADDIGDPFGAGVDAARLTVRLLAEAVNGVLAALGTAPGQATAR